MDFGIGSAAGAVVGLIGAGLQAQAEQDANQVAWANLQFQRQQADNQFRLSSAGRTDAYGNTQVYDPITNTWKTNLTPTQNQIVKAGEGEQLRSLTTDAARNRQQRLNAIGRANQAAEDYNTALAGFRYDDVPSEGAIGDQILTALRQGSEDTTKTNKDTLMLQALRLGRGQDIPQLIKSANDDLGQKLGGQIAQSRDLARQEFAQRTQQHDQHYLPEMQAFDRIINEANPAALQPFSNVPAELSAMQGQQANSMLSALSAGSNEIGSANATLASALGKSPDLSGVAKILAGIGGGSKSNKNSNLTATGQDAGQWTNQPNNWWQSPEYQAWNDFNPFANGNVARGTGAWGQNFGGGGDNSWQNGELF